MRAQARGIARKPPQKRTSAAAMLESVFACKWSARILAAIRDGLHRPGSIERGLEGLSAKVLNDCLRRLVSFGLLHRFAYAEIPPRVEYRLTGLGERFVVILDAVEELQQEIQHDRPPTDHYR